MNRVLLARDQTAAKDINFLQYEEIQKIKKNPSL